VPRLTIALNGRRVTLDDGTTVADVVSLVTEQPEPKGVAVAIDRAVVPRSEWATTTLRAGASVEVVTAAAGG